MKNGKNYLSTFLLILTSVVIFNSACKKEVELKNVPVIPPAFSMTIDFSGISLKKDGPVSLTNWQYSAISLALWNTFLNVNCAVPLTAFQKVMEKNAANVEKNVWEWKRKFDADSLLINARLRGKTENDSVEWKLYISTIEQGVANKEFIWVEGKSASNQSGGWWLFYENQYSQIPYIKIYWTKNSNNQGTTKCIYVKPGNPSTGDFIESGSLDNPFFDTYYHLKIDSGNLIYIEINKATKEGHIRSDLIFDDISWHCWNSSLVDVICEN